MTALGTNLHESSAPPAPPTPADSIKTGKLSLLPAPQDLTWLGGEGQHHSAQHSSCQVAIGVLSTEPLLPVRRRAMEAAGCLASSWGASGSGGQEREMQSFTLMNGVSAKAHHHLARSKSASSTFIPDPYSHIPKHLNFSCRVDCYPSRVPLPERPRLVHPSSPPEGCLLDGEVRARMDMWYSMYGTVCGVCVLTHHSHVPALVVRL